jgi:predicted HTH domain antitoxin
VGHEEWYLDFLWGSKEVSLMSTLTIELPEDLNVALQRSPRELAQDVRLAAAIDWYRRGLISQGRAAEVAGIPRADFIDALASRKIEVVQVDLEALDRELGLG